MTAQSTVLRHTTEVLSFPPGGLQVDLNSVSTLLSTSLCEQLQNWCRRGNQSIQKLNQRRRVQDLYQSRSINNTSSLCSGPNKSFLSMRSQRVCPPCIRGRGTRQCTAPTSPRQGKLPGIHSALPAVPVEDSQSGESNSSEMSRRPI